MTSPKDRQSPSSDRRSTSSDRRSTETAPEGDHAVIAGAVATATARAPVAVAAPAHQRPLLGMLLVAIASLGFSCMHVVVRRASENMHPFEVAFFRNIFGLCVLAPFFVRHGLGMLYTQRARLHALRGTLQVTSMLMFFTALSMVPLAQISALSFTAPLFATVGAVALLGEKLKARRLVALITGFVGALIILRPGLLAIDLGSVLVLGSSLGWALALLVIKRMTSTESSLTLTAWMGLVLTPLSLLPALFFWRWPSFAELPWLMLLGVVGAGSQYLMAEAFRHADATTVLPLDFTRLIWASMLGYLVFGEQPNLWTWIGGVTIFTSTTYIAYRESRASA